MFEVLYEVFIPGLLLVKPVAYNNRLLSIKYGLLWGIEANYVGLLGFSGRLYRRSFDPSA